MAILTVQQISRAGLNPALAAAAALLTWLLGPAGRRQAAAGAWLRSRLAALGLGAAPRAPELAPLPRVPRLTAALPELADPGHKGELMWGSYRSGLYFGMSTR